MHHQARWQCRRPGCHRRRTRQQGGLKPFCSALCSLVARELRRTEQLCRTAPDNPAAGQLWAAAVAFGDSLTELNKQRRNLTRNQPTQDNP